VTARKNAVTAIKARTYGLQARPTPIIQGCSGPHNAPAHWQETWQQDKEKLHASAQQHWKAPAYAAH